MAGTWVVCAQCGKVQECTPDGKMPEGWRQVGYELWCSRCSDANEDEATGDVLDEEVLYPSTPDALDEDFEEGFCEVCKGPCQGH